MASTKRWTDNCMGWTPLHSMIYFSMLFYIQTIRAMVAAGPGAFPLCSEYYALLSTFSLESLLIPGPLVQFFRNLASFNPSESDSHGNVTPKIPNFPPWSQETNYSLATPYHYYLPNIAAMISRLRSICAVAERDGMNEQLFATDANGPHCCGALFGEKFTNTDYERALLSSPGLGLSLPGNLHLWSNASPSFYFSGVPTSYDVKVDAVDKSWATFLQLNSCSEWLSFLSSTMAKYCQFWRGSVSLAECSPSCSGTGGVRCDVDASATNFFDAIPWIPQTQGRDGHYKLPSFRKLTFNARSTIRDLPLHMQQAALVYAPNLVIDAALPGIRHGPFWDIQPDAIVSNSVSLLHGVLISS